jgi:hypothetical protein
MQNFFSFLGFIFTSMLCGALFFILVGRDKGQRGGEELTAGDRTEAGLDMPEPLAMTPIAGERAPKRGTSAKGKKVDRAYAPETPAIEDEGLEEADLKKLYADASFVQKTARQWKERVREASEMHNIRPQALLAHVIVQTYIDRGYSDREFRRDLGAHAGDRVMPYNAAVSSYPNGWSVNYIATKYDLLQHFPARTSPRIAVVSSSTAKGEASVKKTAAALPSASKERRLAASSPRESSLRDMVAQQYGFKNWTDLQQRARPTVRTQAENKVKGMKPAMMIR